MKNKKSPAKRSALSLIIFVVLLLLLAGGLLWLNIYVTQNPGEEISLNYDTRNGDAINSKVFVQITPGANSWENANKDVAERYGTEYSGTISNNTDSTIEDWEICFKIPRGSYIDSSWSGVYTLSPDGSAITVTSVDYNASLPAHTSQTFGFIMYTSQAIEITSFTVEASALRTLGDYPLFWVLLLSIFTVFVIMVTYMISTIKYHQIQSKYRHSHEVTEQALRTFAKIIDVKDEYTSGHSYRVAIYTRALAKRLGMTDDEQERMYYIALLHDIGKVGIPVEILGKNGRLTEDEFALIKTHPSIGGDILKEFSSIPGVEDGARYHHERYDGNGYGEGLIGEQIPLCARIICVADAYDAMSSARCYRSRMDTAHIIRELTECSGTQFDPRIAAVMLDLINSDALPATTTAVTISANTDLR